MAFSVTGGYAACRILVRQSLVEEVNSENVLTYNVYKHEINLSLGISQYFKNIYYLVIRSITDYNNILIP
jgi:hypothetical protein